MLTLQSHPQYSQGEQVDPKRTRLSPPPQNGRLKQGPLPSPVTHKESTGDASEGFKEGTQSPQAVRSPRGPGGLSSGQDVFELSATIADLHRKNNTFPGEVYVRLAAEVLADASRGKENREFQYAVLCSASIAGGSQVVLPIPFFYCRHARPGQETVGIAVHRILLNEVLSSGMSRWQGVGQTGADRLRRHRIPSAPRCASAIIFAGA